jgi:hypothetical protein
MIEKLLTQQKWIIVAFAPGAYGYKLGKWLANNRLANINNFENFVYYNSTDKNNHNYVGCFSDVLLSFGQTEDYIKKELIGHFPNLHLITDILSSSISMPFKLVNAQQLILTHYSQYRVLYELSNLFTESKIIRITFDSQDQAIDAIKRKRSLDKKPFDLINDWGDLCDNYFPFLHKFKFTIDVPVNKVENLELDFLKELV